MSDWRDDVRAWPENMPAFEAQRILLAEAEAEVEDLKTRIVVLEAALQRLTKETRKLIANIRRLT